MSIFDNIAFGVRLFERLSRREMEERVEWALTRAALWPRSGESSTERKQPVGGQQQRCASRAASRSGPRCCSTSPARRSTDLHGPHRELIHELKSEYTV